MFIMLNYFWTYNLLCSNIIRNPLFFYFLAKFCLLFIYNEHLYRIALSKIKNIYINTFTNFCCQMGPVKKKELKENYKN